MRCQNCHELIEPGAAFCGNCGQPVQPIPPANLPTNQPLPQQPLFQPAPLPTQPSPPQYAIANPQDHNGEIPAILSIVSGVIGIAGSLIFPFIGFGFGIIGLVAGTLSRRVSKRTTAIVGLIISTLAIIAGIAALVYTYNSNQPVAQKPASAKTISQLSTDCYSFNLIDRFNITQNKSTCDASIFNNSTFTTSTNVYRIVTTNSGTNDVGQFNLQAKAAIDKDIADNFSDYTITKEEPSSFAGSIDYIAYFNNSKIGISGSEAAILHPTHKVNIFIILHAINGTNADLQTLESNWQWK